MAFNLFGKKPPHPDSAPVEDAEAGDEEAADELPEEAPSPDEIDAEWRDRAAAVIPGGTSTGSKRPAALYGPTSSRGPSHYVRAQGCHLVTAGDQTLIDCTMALGSVSLGYGDDAVTRAVISALAQGPVAGLAHTLEVEIAERLCEVIPCAERVRFLKTGAEAMSAAVRVARALTGRERLVTAGYFGWHDWANTASGIPHATRALTTAIPFNDIHSLETAVSAAGKDLAAIVIEPVVEALPAPEWIARARALATQTGAALIFDELKTGFRLSRGGYQEFGDTRPDLAVFGKAMANGYPVAALVGSVAAMDAATETWISSTAAGEAGALAAIGAVLDRYDEPEGDVCAELARIGATMRTRVSDALVAAAVPGVRVAGIDPMWLLRFENAQFETTFLEHAASLGLLLKRGAYNYAALAHDDDDVMSEFERLVSTTCVELMERGESE